MQELPAGVEPSTTRPSRSRAEHAAALKDAMFDLQMQRQDLEKRLEVEEILCAGDFSVCTELECRLARVEDVLATRKEELALLQAAGKKSSSKKCM